MNIVHKAKGEWTNWSINRMMLFRRKQADLPDSAESALGIIHDQWK